MTTFANYIFKNKGSIIIYPKTVNSTNVIATLIKQPGFAGKKIAFLTENKNEINDAVGVKLPDELYFKYNDYENVNKINDSADIIFVDNIYLFLQNGLSRFFKPLNKNTHIVFLATLGIEPEQIEIIYRDFGKLKLLKTYYINQLIGLEYEKDITLLNHNQQLEYEKRNLDEISNDNYKSLQKIKTLQIGNFIYPEKLQNYLDLPSDDERRKLVPEDKLVSQGGWLDERIIPNLKQYSRKFNLLLTKILTNANKHHVVYTQFKARYGAYLISTLLTLLDIKNILITGDDKVAVRNDKVRLFNVGDIPVLITTVGINEDIKNVNYLHFLEGHDIKIYNTLLNSIYKRKNYDNPDNLVVVEHISMQEDGNNTSDGYFYLKFANYVKEINEFYKSLITDSDNLVLDAEKGIIVL